MSENIINDQPDRRARELRRIRWGVVVGTALEWFDFYLYATMAALIFGKVFFPSENSLSSLAAFATFTVGFIVRPLGGVVFGYLGDRFGRKAVLSMTFILMGLATGCIGLIPSYASIGIAAPIILIALRIVQGLGAGAEGTTATVLAYEHADRNSRGRQAAWPALGTSIGLLGASLTIAALTSFGDDFVYGGGWRIPFVFSFLLVFLGYAVRRRMPETPTFTEMKKANPPSQRETIRRLLGANWRGLAAVMVVTTGYLGASYTFKTFSISYLQQFKGVAANVGSFGVALASAVALVVIPISGRLTDRFGTRRLMLAGAAGIAVIAFPFFWALDTAQPFYIWTALIISSGVLIPMLLATTSSFMAAQFPAEVRTSGLGAGREIAAALAGGLVPLAAISMVTLSDSHSTIGVSMIFVASAAALALACLLDQSGRVNSDPSPDQTAPTLLDTSSRSAPLDDRASNPTLKA